MRTGSFGYDVRARCRAADAMTLLSDLHRQGELHPLIVEVRDLPPVPGAVRSYAIRDRLAWGPLRFGITYLADTLRVTDSEIVTEARQRPRTTIRNRTTVSEESEGRVHVAVQVELTAPTLLHGYALRTARTAHLALAERLRDVLERTGQDRPVR